jgi:hypothetical protein
MGEDWEGTRMTEHKHYQRLTITGTDQPGVIEVESTFINVVENKTVDIVVVTRIPVDHKRTIGETERLIRQIAIAALQA